ncbi:hypothetical protein Tco_0928062 [Tanacetum coccineum]
MAMSLKSTPVPTKRKTRLNKTEDIVLPYDLEDISGQPRIRSINHIMTHDPFVENLSRPDGCKSDKVTVPEYMSAFINNKDLPEYQFPWGKRDIVIGRSFWLSLSCLNIGKSGWLTDQHLDVWIDLMWSLRPPEADWAIVSPHFSTCILNGMMQDYFSNGHMYPLPWIAVEKIGYLDLTIGNLFSFLKSLPELFVSSHGGSVWMHPRASGSKRRWWRRMKKVLLEKLTLYLLMHGIFDSKGISADHYKITYNYAFVPFQASLYGHCGIWGAYGCILGNWEMREWDVTFAQQVEFLFKVNFLTLFTNTMGRVATLKGQICLDLVRCLREESVKSDIDWCGYIHSCLKDSELLEKPTLYYFGPFAFLILLYLDSTKFDRFPDVRTRPAIRDWTSTLMRKRQDLETKEHVIWCLDLHNEWTESELQETEGFTRVSSLEISKRKALFKKAEEKCTSICSERVVLEDLMRKASLDYPDGGIDSDGEDDGDDNNDDGNGNNDEELNDDNDDGNVAEKVWISNYKKEPLLKEIQLKNVKS